MNKWKHLTALGDSHPRLPHPLLDSPTSLPSPTDEAACPPTKLICQVRRYTEKPESFTFQSNQPMLFPWTAFIVWLIESIAWLRVLAHVIPTAVHRVLALAFHLCRPVPLCPFTFFWEEDKHPSLPWNRFSLHFSVSTLMPQCSPPQEEKCAVETILWVFISFFEIWAKA